MSDQRYKTVVQGEASESSDEEEADTSVSGKRDVPMSVVVEGEASESEEEELDSSGQAIRPELPPLTLNESSMYEALEESAHSPTLSHRQAGKPKYDTVLNRKLWESNLSLCNNLNGVSKQTYLSAAKEITNCGHQLSRSHASIQDVSHNLRLLTNDLFNLDDGIDIITSCTILPNIQQPERRAPDPVPSAAPSSDTSAQQSSS